MNDRVEVPSKNFRVMRRDGLIRQGTRGLNSNAAINSQQSVTGSGIRKKKGIKSKKIPERFTVREYETNEMSSKWDIKIRQILENTQSINDDKHYLLGEDKKISEQRTMMGLNSFQLKSFFFQREEDLEEDNTKKMMTFFYHGRTFTYCKESCQLFKKEHLIRRLSVWITEWNFYKFLTFMTILTMSVFMGLHNYQLSSSQNMAVGGYQSIFSYTKFFYISYFAIEIVLKIIARGLYQSPNSYLRNINNCIIIIIFGIITIYDTSFIFLLIFRIFYIFEFTNKIKILRYSYTILKLYQISAETLCKLFFLIFFFITLFGILSTSIWSGVMDYRIHMLIIFYSQQRCRITPIPEQGDWILAPINRLCGGRFSCPNDYYCGSNYNYNKNSTSYVDNSNMDLPTSQREFNYGITNFDNLFRSYLTLFQILLVEGYYNIMYMLEDSHDTYIPVVFITCYFLVCTYFLNNLIIAIFFIKYQSIEAEEEKKRSAQKKKPALVRFQGQQQQFDNMTGSNTNPNSTYNQRVGQYDYYPRNTNKIVPEQLLTINNRDPSFKERKIQKISTLTNVQQPPQTIIRRQKSKSMQDFFEPELNQQGKLKSINETEEADVKHSFRKQRFQAFKNKVSLRSNEEIVTRDRKFTFENSEFDEGRKQKLSIGGDFNESKPYFRSDTNGKNNSFHMLRSNLSGSTTRKRNFSKIPFSPSTYGTSFINLNSSKNFFYGKNKMNGKEPNQKDEWNDRIKDIIDIILNNKIFIFLINFCILVNMIVLSFNQYPQLDNSIESIIKQLNFIFILIFLVEDFMRIFQTQKTYQFMILTSEIIIDIISTATSIRNHDLVPLSALKGLRILYAFTSVKSWVHYRILLDAINHSISSVLNIMLIAFSFMYLGAIIGMWLFGGKLKFNDNGGHDLINGRSPRFNFDDIFSAFTTVFTATQGDYWNNVWMDCVRSVGGWTAHPYFILLMITGKLVFINSFTAIMLTSFEYAKKKSELGVRGAKAVLDQISHLRIQRKTHQNIKKGFLKALNDRMGIEQQQEKDKENNIQQSLHKDKNAKIKNLQEWDEKEEENRKSCSVDSEHAHDKNGQKDIGRSKTLSNHKIPLDLECLTEGALLSQPNQQSDSSQKSPEQFQKNKSLNVQINDTDLNNKSKAQKQNDKALIQQVFKGFHKSNTIVPETNTIKKSGFSQNTFLQQKYKQQIVDKGQDGMNKEKKRLGVVGFYLKYSSCFLFNKSSFIRVGCQKIISSPYWDNFFLSEIN